MLDHKHTFSFFIELVNEVNFQYIILYLSTIKINLYFIIIVDKALADRGDFFLLPLDLKVIF